MIGKRRLADSLGLKSTIVESSINYASMAKDPLSKLIEYAANTKKVRKIR
jgi:hypothetical protein